MAYTPNPEWVNGLDGTVISASKLNRMEDGLVAAAAVADEALAAAGGGGGGGTGGSVPRLDAYTASPLQVPHRVTLDYPLSAQSSDLYQVLVNGRKVAWQNEWGALRGSSPYTWGDALVRGVREDGDGITQGNFQELVDRRTGAADPVMYGRRYTDARLVRFGHLMMDSLLLGSTDPVPPEWDGVPVLIFRTI